MMNYKDIRIDSFLKFFKDIIVQNPQYEISSNNIYYELTRIGIDENERNIHVTNMFQKWITNFKNKNNIDVYVDPKWSYFCQFVNRGNEIISYKDHLKLYVPLNYSHLEYGANIIFEFLRKNNIPHISKIGKCIRFDNIVIRLINKEDLEKLINFINTNDYIQEGLNEPNPFAYNENGLAMVCDGYLSYNRTVSKYICLYLKERKIQNALDNISAYDFYKFIEKYYSLAFIQKIYSKQKIYEDFCDNGEMLDFQNFTNLERITKLILNSHNIDFTFDDYIYHYENGLKDNLDTTKQELNDYSGIENMMNYIIHVMTYRFGSLHMAKKQIMAYIQEGNPRYLTNELGLRKKIVSSSFKNDLVLLLSKLNMDLSEYIDYIINKKIKISLEGDKEQKLIFAISNTYERYGYNQVVFAIKKLLNEDSYDGFTNKNKARECLMHYVTSKDLNIMIKITLGLEQDIKTFTEEQLNSFFNEIFSFNSKSI